MAQGWTPVIDRSGKYPRRMRGKVCVGMKSYAFIPSAKPEPEFLSERQQQILTYIANDETVIGIANIMHLSPKTVEYHVWCLKRKLGPKYQGIAALTKLALRLRLIKNDA